MTANAGLNKMFIEAYECLCTHNLGQDPEILGSAFERQLVK